MAEQIRGLTAPLTEEGYQRVADLRNDAEMSLYIHRVAASLGRKVTNLGDLGGFAPFFSGTTQVQSLAQMQAELAGKDFVAEGVEPEFEASLTEDGYQKVAALKDDGKMAHFIRRVCAAEVRRVIDEDGLNGFSPFFSGTTSVQTLEKMREEIRGSSWSEVYAPPELAAWMVRSAEAHISRLVLRSRASRMPSAWCRRSQSRASSSSAWPASLAETPASWRSITQSMRQSQAHAAQ
mmetsp:Transcript_2933/g.6388  ORF Transcript_2933/g.6388 Transcript_2933/m.6388 type:complete len:236 (+) Transcript_2933:74-781(+)